MINHNQSQHPNHNQPPTPCPVTTPKKYATVRLMSLHPPLAKSRTPLARNCRTCYEEAFSTARIYLQRAARRDRDGLAAAHPSQGARNTNPNPNPSQGARNTTTSSSSRGSSSGKTKSASDGALGKGQEQGPGQGQGQGQGWVRSKPRRIVRGKNQAGSASAFASTPGPGPGPDTARPHRLASITDTATPRRLASIDARGGEGKGEGGDLTLTLTLTNGPPLGYNSGSSGAPELTVDDLMVGREEYARRGPLGTRHMQTHDKVCPAFVKP